ncbi:DNA-binding protein [bacterium]|nr:DNA-binding protein [bacterium]
MCLMLGGIGPKAAYQLLHEGHIRYFKIGKAFRIPKMSVIDYIQG